MIDFNRIEIFKKASLCRNFEEKVFDLIKKNTFKFPIYLSAGQEFIAATLAYLLQDKNPYIFAQHRAHSTYLAFGGNIDALIKELLGKSDGCANGMGGSASIQGKDINMFGHDGLMGSQVPIAVGSCFTNKKPTITFFGDAAAEEDYVMAAIAWASTKNLPMLFIVEDNNLSILTEKKVRRNWEMHDFANSVKMNAVDIEDDPIQIYNSISNLKLPCLLNIKTDRLFWHAGAGIDEYEKRDRYKLELKELGNIGTKIHNDTKQYINDVWEKHLETL